MTLFAGLPGVSMNPKVHVLLVNESRNTLAQLEQILNEIDDLALVGVALNGAAAIRMTNESKPDLVLMDLELPGLRALSALRTIRSMHPAVEVAMVSAASGHNPAWAEALKIGACEVIGKPFDTDEIESLVEDIRTGLRADFSTLD